MWNPKYVDFKSCTSSLSRSLTFSNFNHFLETSWGKELPPTWQNSHGGLTTSCHGHSLLAARLLYWRHQCQTQPSATKKMLWLVGSTWFNLSQDIPVWFPSFRLEKVFKKWNYPSDHWLDTIMYLGNSKTSLQLAGHWIVTATLW